MQDSFAPLTRASRPSEVERSEAHPAGGDDGDAAGFFGGLLLASLSHDLRTPLTSIIGATSALRGLGDALTAEHRASLLGTIEAEARRLDRTVASLLELAKLDQAGLRARAEPVDLREALAAARARLGEALAGCDLMQAVDAAAPVLADRTLLELVLANLIENAARHGAAAGAGGAIRIVAHAEASRIRLTVADDGPGVPAHDRERIFEPFRQGASSTDGAEEGPAGTGLGLAIARGFARAMGGDVLVREPAGRRDGEGGGACFELTLPRVEAKAVEPHREAGGVAARG